MSGGGNRAELVRGADAGGSDVATGGQAVDAALLQEAEHVCERGGVRVSSSAAVVAKRQHHYCQAS